MMNNNYGCWTFLILWYPFMACIYCPMICWNLSVACSPAVALLSVAFSWFPHLSYDFANSFLSVDIYLVLCLACWGNCWLLLTCPFTPFYAGVWSTFKHDTWRCGRGCDNCWDRWWNIWRNCARKFICFSPLILDKCSVSQLVKNYWMPGYHFHCPSDFDWLC